MMTQPHSTAIEACGRQQPTARRHCRPQYMWHPVETSEAPNLAQ